MTIKYPIKKLGDLCDIRIGGTPSRDNKSYWQKGEYLWVSIADMSRSGASIIDTKEKITKAGVENSNVKLIPKGTLIFSFKLSIGKLAFVNKDLYTNEAIAGLVINDNKELDKEYLYHFLSQMTFADTTSAVKGKTLNKEKIKNLNILLPPLTTQREIVDHLTEKLEALHEAQTHRESALLDTEKILSTRLGEIFQEGKKEGWMEDRLEDIAVKVADGTHDTPKYFDTGFPLITSKNLLPDGISFSNIKYISKDDHEQISKRSGIQKGDLLIAMIGTIGNITTIEGDEEFSIKNVGLIRPDESKVLGKFIKYALNNSRLSQLVVSKGATQKFIGLGQIRDIKISFPLLPVQQEIVAELDILSDKIKALKQLQTEQLADMKRLEIAFLRETFTQS